MAIVDVEDPDAVLDVVLERVLELRVEAGVPVHVIPLRPPERVVHTLQHQRTHPTSPALL